MNTVEIQLTHNNKNYTANLQNGYDLSLSFGAGGDNPNAFHILPSVNEPIKVGDFVGSVAQGSGANCFVTTFCAHGNGTHTECCGHITLEHHSINKHLPAFFCAAELITINPKLTDNGDYVLDLSCISNIELNNTEALIIRTLPNEVDKKSRSWSGQNPVYCDHELLQFLASKNYLHLLIDLPSVDREEDEGKMLAHKAWWYQNSELRTSATITELIYIDDKILDGLYLLNLQVAPMESDAAPSRPVIFELKEK